MFGAARLSGDLSLPWTGTAVSKCFDPDHRTPEGRRAGGALPEGDLRFWE